MRRDDCCRVLCDAILHGSLNFSSLFRSLPPRSRCIIPRRYISPPLGREKSDALRLLSLRNASLEIIILFFVPRLREIHFFLFPFDDSFLLFFSFFWKRISWKRRWWKEGRNYCRFFFFFFFFRGEYETNFCLDIFANTVNTEKLDQFITMSISFEESITRVLSFLFFFADEIFFRIEGKRIIGKKIWKACFLLLRF